MPLTACGNTMLTTRAMGSRMDSIAHNSTRNMA